MMTDGAQDCKTDESRVTEDRVNEVIEWDARARSATINSERMMR